MDTLTSVNGNRLGPLLGMLVATLLLAGCGGGGGGGGSGNGGGSTCDDFDCQGMLENLANNIMLPTYQSFETEAGELVTAVDSYCGALGGTGDEHAARESAQQAWREAMAVWQQAEVMQVGPLVERSGSLRYNIYSWPDFVNSCAVDQSVIAARDTADFAITDTTSPEERGLDSLEYLLFNEDMAHSCPGDNIIAPEAWNERPEPERRQARCEYAALVAADVADQAHTLVSHWQGPDGDFLEELTNTGADGSRFSNVEEAVNAVSDALFYVEKQTKDTKLAVPLGLKSNSCQGGICPEDVESLYARVSKENIRENFLALQRMFLGNEPGAGEARLGFDDFLEAVGGVNTANMMGQAIDEAVSAVSDQTMPGTLWENLQTRQGLVSSAHDSAKEVTDELKRDFLEVLGLSIPGSAAGDGD